MSEHGVQYWADNYEYHYVGGIDFGVPGSDRSVMVVTERRPDRTLHHRIASHYSDGEVYRGAWMADSWHNRSDVEGFARSNQRGARPGLEYRVESEWLTKDEAAAQSRLERELREERFGMMTVNPVHFVGPGAQRRPTEKEAASTGTTAAIRSAPQRPPSSIGKTSPAMATDQKAGGTVRAISTPNPLSNFFDPDRYRADADWRKLEFKTNGSNAFAQVVKEADYEIAQTASELPYIESALAWLTRTAAPLGFKVIGVEKTASADWRRVAGEFEGRGVYRFVHETVFNKRQEWAARFFLVAPFSVAEQTEEALAQIQRRHVYSAGIERAELPEMPRRGPVTFEAKATRDCGDGLP